MENISSTSSTTSMDMSSSLVVSSTVTPPPNGNNKNKKKNKGSRNRQTAQQQQQKNDVVESPMVKLTNDSNIATKSSGREGMNVESSRVTFHNNNNRENIEKINANIRSGGSSNSATTTTPQKLNNASNKQQRGTSDVVVKKDHPAVHSRTAVPCEPQKVVDDRNNTKNSATKSRVGLHNGLEKQKPGQGMKSSPSGKKSLPGMLLNTFSMYKVKY